MLKIQNKALTLSKVLVDPSTYPPRAYISVFLKIMKLKMKIKRGRSSSVKEEGLMTLIRILIWNSKLPMQKGAVKMKSYLELDRARMLIRMECMETDRITTRWKVISLMDRNEECSRKEAHRKRNV